MTGQAGLGEWWTSLGATALVGTGRRSMPTSPLPVADRPDGSPETVLLDHVAIGTALRRAGRLPAQVPAGQLPEPAVADELPLAPARARQLLDLLLTQSPVGARLAPRAIEAWLLEAGRSGFRVHHATLVPLLDLATTARQLRSTVAPVLDQRGKWLAGLNPAWSWVLAEEGVSPGQVDDREWALLPTDQRAHQLRALRATDPDRGRSLLTSTWATEAATARADLLRAFGVGLGVQDEAFLEQALDDRSGSVRDVACLLLDRLPGSARAQRMGRRLGPLLSTTGVVRKKVHLELPPPPDPSAVRDGLGKAPKGRSQRGSWMQRIASGAPLDVWTRATGLDPRTIVQTLDDPDALAGIRAAAVGRGDPTWCRALLELAWDPNIARWLPAEELVDHLLARVGEAKNLADLTSALRTAPGHWSADVSKRVVARLARIDRPRHQLTELVDLLAAGLHPSVAPQVQRLATTDDGTVVALQQLSQFLSLVPTITEAFR